MLKAIWLVFGWLEHSYMWRVINRMHPDVFGMKYLIILIMIMSILTILSVNLFMETLSYMDMYEINLLAIRLNELAHKGDEVISIEKDLVEMHQELEDILRIIPTIETFRDLTEEQVLEICKNLPKAKEDEKRYTEQINTCEKTLEEQKELFESMKKKISRYIQPIASRMTKVVDFSHQEEKVIIEKEEDCEVNEIAVIVPEVLSEGEKDDDNDSDMEISKLKY